MRLIGIYPQTQPGLNMQRIKVHGGCITPAQLGQVAELVARYTPDYPVHLTTRQDIELHGVRAEDLPAVQQGVHAAGLTCVGACGDTLRNVTVCPGNGLSAGKTDVTELAAAVRAAAESLSFVRSLPRKFKITLSGCQKACSRPWINDLGFVARGDGTFRAIGAGSLGPVPGVGIELYERLSVEYVIPLVVAALRLFNDLGDREHRGRARLRHVRERLGDDAFRGQLDERFRTEQRTSVWPVPSAPSVKTGKALLARLRLPLGDMAAGSAIALARELARADVELRFGFDHEMLLYGRSMPDLPADVQPLAGAPAVIACPGSAWCTRGIADSRALGAALYGRGARRRDLAVCVGGCPNNCSQAPVADIGLIGRIKTVNGVKTPCFRLLAGGGRGVTPAMARELHSAVPAAKAPEAVDWLESEFAAGAAHPNEPFADFVSHEGERLTALLEKRL